MDSLEKKNDDIPPHAFTRKEYRERYGLGESATVKRLSAMVREGILLQGTRKVKDDRGCRATTFYWVSQ